MTIHTVREAAAQLKIHPKTLEAYCRHRQIAAVKVGRLWRIPEEALRRFVHGVPSAASANGGEHAWSALATVKLAEVWNHPEEISYAL